MALTVSATHDVGNTQFGRRRQLDVSGGTITGDKLKGTVLTGGLDYELSVVRTGRHGAGRGSHLEDERQRHHFHAHLRRRHAAGDSVVRIVPDIEAPTSGSYAWLNTTKLVGTRVVAGGKITLDVYDVSNVASSAIPKVQLKDPARASPT